MSTVVVTTGVYMSINKEWGKAIQDLLDRHNLTVRGAAIKAERPNLRTYLADWRLGQLPQYKTAIDFLEHFPREEAIECLNAAGYSIPADWMEEHNKPTIPPEYLDKVRIALRGKPGASEETIKLVFDAIKDILEQDARKGSKE